MPVHSAMALITTLLAQAGLYLMLYAPFVAGVQIILYAGGIMVLFLFVIMLVNLERTVKERQFNKQWLVGIVAAARAGRPVYRGLYAKGRNLFPEGRMTYSEGQNTQDIAPCFMTEAGHVHVLVRDRLPAAAGGDHRRGGDGEEKNLEESCQRA